ncbi:sugar transferase [Alphaproteobacteria bacterium]|nr:sugar transferase [Alphaproteobacteria bacterium]
MTFEIALPRILDLAILMLVLPIACLLMLIFLPFVFLSDFRNPLFIQKRLGKNKQEFYLIKIRTMSVDAESETGAIWARPNDERVTPVGRLLRKYWIDELPQLVNILLGQLSFVGPRPIRGVMAERIAEHDPEYHLRFLVTPGLTGLAQVFAPYGSNLSEQLEKGYWDRQWVKCSSMKLYFLTLFWTLLKLSSQNRWLERIKSQNISNLNQHKF